VTNASTNEMTDEKAIGMGPHLAKFFMSVYGAHFLRVGEA
jgi:hypothetical protein